tara:strand:- start:357 stop:722 length:366 start_codon:yes stop_codon:yes gene_type:complete
MSWKTKVAKKVWGKIMPKSKSNFIKDKAGTIVGVKPGTGKVPWYVGAGKNLKERSQIVKTHKRSQTIDKIDDAEKKIKEGTATLKKLRTTGWTGKPYGRRGKKQYFPKKEGEMAHTIKKKK